MTIKTFWTTFLKIIGLYLLIASLAVIPQFFSSLLFIRGDDAFEQTAMAIFFVGATLGIYILVIQLFLFRSSWLIEKLKLDEGFTEDRIYIRISSNSIIKIAIIVVGGLLLIDSLPSFCREVFEFFQRQSIFRESPSAGWIIFHLVKTIIGYILLSHSKFLANIIAKTSETELDEPMAETSES